ncbi:ankyrin repeat domain-containing protein [Formosa sp. PL04]|uniref:ankyrin repeat domain-containing protein n=1 Tax=Formosa sp. PL04 TaxID=3081755 RepID=UPI0029822F00|nr:ankyrin repeat domain-containing protein [Formosa sp. PL04]MDW5290717.1 ankyrin repeat domain-containing protein [Formosa sp. PL04]
MKQGATLSNEQHIAAVKFGHYESLVEVANNQPDTIFNDGSSLLHLLVDEGENELIETVLQKSTKTINIQNKKGDTALHIATYAYDQTPIKLLIEAGADLYLLNKVGENVLNTINPDMSCESVLYFKDATKLFFQKSQYYETPIEAVLRKGYFKSMPAFIQIYYEMGDDTIYKYGFTALQMAAALGIGNAMEVLTKSGNLHVINENGENLLAFAIKLEPYNKEFSYTQRLLDAGLNPNTPNKEGNTLLQICAKEGKSWAIDVLLKDGANADILDKRGRTALHYAAESGFHNLVPSLLKYGATPSIKDNEGVTPKELGEAYSDEIAEMFSNY